MTENVNTNQELTSPVLIQSDLSQTELRILAQEDTKTQEPAEAPSTLVVDTETSGVPTSETASFTDVVEEDVELEDAFEEVQTLDNTLFQTELTVIMLESLTKAMRVILNRVKEVNSVESPVTTYNSAGRPLSYRDVDILEVLEDNIGHFVKTKSIAKLVGGSADISSSVSRLRRHGFVIESAQTARKNGELLPSNVTGYRLTTAKQVASREASNQIRGLLTDLLTSVGTEGTAQ